MKRRDFFKAAGTTGAALASGSILSCNSRKGPDQQVFMERPFPLKEVSILDLQKSMEIGEYTSRQITDLYLKRIIDIDRGMPGLNSVIELNPDALDIAEQLDKEREKALIRGPLHGIPVLIKDNIETKDNMMTTAGSLALEGNYPDKDAFVIDSLRKAGAIILGKTNLSEWANFRSLRSTSGWSGRGGQTCNPYALDRNPCGSSSGSGAAVSANLCAAALGTETNGSVVCPSHANGIVGIKPTLGLVSRTGIIPLAHSQDTAGPMARCVADAALLLSYMTGYDKADPVTNNPYKAFRDYTTFLNTTNMRGKRIGVARQFFEFHDRVDALMEEAINVIKDLGATVIDPVNIDTLNTYGDDAFEVLLYEFKADINHYLSKLPPELAVHSLKELIDFNEKQRGKEMPWFDQELLVMANERDDLTTPEYIKSLEKVKRLSGPEGIDAVIQKHQLDAIIAPTGGPAWRTDWVNGDHFMGASSSPAARAGYPNMTLPCGFVFGLPVGISFFAGAFSEPILLQLAWAYECATKVRKPPAFLNYCNMNTEEI